MSLAFKIASRYLRSKKAHSAVNIISIISVCGIVVTTAALICVLSVFNGFRDVIMGRLALLDPPVAVMPATGKTIANGDSVARVITGLPEVEMAVPVVQDNALAIFTEYQMPVKLKGVPTDYNRVSCIDSVIIDGDFMLQDQVAQYAILGVGPAIQLHVRPGFLRMLQLYAPKRVGNINMSNPMGAFRADSLFVSAIFQLQQSKYDNDLIYVPIDFARRIFDYENEASQVEIVLNEGYDEQAAIKSIENVLGPGYLVKNRLMQQATAYRLVNVEKWISFLLLTFILIIATFNVISSLSLLIMEKDDSIATLRAMGASDKQISAIFVAESWIITFVGTIAGIIIGLALCLGQQHFGWLRLSGDPNAMIINSYPVQVQFTDVLVVIALAALIGLITSAVTTLIVNRRIAAGNR
ncbi:MAG: FtsX-like permease family protein [Muribaculaceae bacterium]|nr:FtsX-like permease family protein [Muribaculaceae bacterium]